MAGGGSAGGGDTGRGGSAARGSRFSSRASKAAADRADPRIAFIREICLDLPDATVDQPFDDTTDVFRIHRKMFALLTPVAPGPQDQVRLNLKVDPDELPGLIAAHEAITPGYHMSKKHWVSVVFPEASRIDVIDPPFLEGLIEDSYDLVLSKIPQSQRRKL